MRIAVRFHRSHFALLVIACLLTAFSRPSLAKEPNPFKPAATPADHGQFVHAVGTVEPEDAVDIGASVAGTVTSVMVDFSSAVRKGQVLAQIDDTALAVRVEMAKASLHQAHANLAVKEAEYAFQNRSLVRMKAASANGAVTADAIDLEQLRFDTARAALESAKAEIMIREAALRLAMTELNATRILSPVDGVIIDCRAHEGQSVVPGSPSGLFRIAKDLHRMRLLLAVNEADIARIHPGQLVWFTLEAFKDARFSGSVVKVRLNAVRKHNVVTYTVEVAFDNADGRVLPCLTAAAQIEVGKGDRDGK